MPNAVYERTRAALSALLPGRAATRVLDRALERHHRSGDEIEAKEMASVLTKSVYRELKGVVPDPGLRRALRRIARDVAGWTPRGARPSEVRAARTAAMASPEAADASARAHAEPADTAVGVEEVPVAAGSVTVETVETVTTAPTPAAAVRAVDGDALLARLAAIDGVHGVGRFDQAGRLLQVRGRLPDPVRLGRFLAAGASLLERRDALRTIAIDAPHGRLVAVPTHPHWLALTGAVDLNLGAVYAALAALEEER
ncbi:MAG: hypothetical protein P1P87_11865 [Trueperaceae bacterium]|nr:hypothetical protein [Trueperaceae bacterium]